jgi:hypothetical protein
MDLSSIQILEIGDHTHVKQTIPERAKPLRTGRRPPKNVSQYNYVNRTPREIAKAARDVIAKKFDVIVASTDQQSAWHPRDWVRAILNRDSTTVLSNKERLR